ncbi:hypothetical protein [Thalassomonas haliotis]|uniref:DUF4149 domain-containing protein n=1 Tax=Thalassomonas haliotis TaxID=485448 RepID=A0ABY7VIM3_9GAMM|nr:hypothetical protein [Thalassomonas haliotis]WDE12896.1 hypothetical protein H3N35_05375 [Thalassomonas haliotis]
MSKRLLALLCCFWLGAIAAITMEAKVKFNASLVDLKIGLDVGRTVFNAFDSFQWLLMLALLMTVLRYKTRDLWILSLSLLLLFSYQSYYLLPQLSQQAAIYIEQGIHSGGNHHWLYLTAELTKVILLTWLTLIAIKIKE